MRGDSLLNGREGDMDVLAAHHCDGTPNDIRNGSLQVAWIVDVMTQVVASLMVCILGSTVTHCNTKDQMTLVE